MKASVVQFELLLKSLVSLKPTGLSEWQFLVLVAVTLVWDLIPSCPRYSQVSTYDGTDISFHSFHAYMVSSTDEYE